MGIATSKKFEGLVQVYTGDGKGKTTASLGLALRALGQGLRVCVIQFMKHGPYYGEYKTLQEWGGARKVEILQFGEPCHYPAIRDRSESCFEECSECFSPQNENGKKQARLAMQAVWQKMRSQKFDIIILDEINMAVASQLVPVDEVLDLLEKKPDSLELVLTGRSAPAEIIEKADLVTMMEKVKHPYDRGIKARRGIEY